MTVPADATQETCSLTHHTFLIGAWPDAPDGSVRVTPLDDPETVVLILKAGDVDPFIDALIAAQHGRPIHVHNSDG